jgi:hypothetical protein
VTSTQYEAKRKWRLRNCPGSGRNGVTEQRTHSEQQDDNVFATGELSVEHDRRLSHVIDGPEVSNANVMDRGSSFEEFARANNETPGSSPK